MSLNVTTSTKISLILPVALLPKLLPQIKQLEWISTKRASIDKMGYYCMTVIMKIITPRQIGKYLCTHFVLTWGLCRNRLYTGKMLHVWEIYSLSLLYIIAGICQRSWKRVNFLLIVWKYTHKSTLGILEEMFRYVS